MHNQTDLDLTRRGEHSQAIGTTLHRRRQEHAQGGHESAREASAANRKRNAQPNGSPMQVKNSGRRKRASVAGRRRSAAAPDTPPLDSSAEALLRWRRDLDLPKPYSAFPASESTRKRGPDWNAPTHRRLSARPQRAPAAGEAVQQPAAAPPTARAVRRDDGAGSPGPASGVSPPRVTRRRAERPQLSFPRVDRSKSIMASEVNFSLLVMSEIFYINTYFGMK